MTPILIGLSLAAAAAFAARALGLLTTSGALAAVVIGTAIFASGGWGLALTLIAAFVLTGLATRYRRWEKLIQPEHRRGRSASQVLANGLVPAALAVVGAALDLSWSLAGAMGAIAASTADTLATEIGLLSTAPPRLITTGKVVSRGRSGGITSIGTICGVGGAMVVGGLGLVFLPLPGGPGWAPVAAGGIAGLVIDSLLGATAQARYRCPACGEEGEMKECPCGGTRTLAGGISWMTNDAVNLLMAAVGGTVAAVLALKAAGA